MAIEMRCESAAGLPYLGLLRSDAAALLRLLQRRESELSLLVVGDPAMRELNRRFRGIDRSTDVLSFPLEARPDDREARHDEQPNKISMLGDVVISVDTALRQARRMRIAPASRLRALLIHGLLHLLGYDHERSIAEARRMFARERELAARLRRPSSKSIRGKARR